jgi:hypothetical protein
MMRVVECVHIFLFWFLFWLEQSTSMGDATSQQTAAALPLCTLLTSDSMTCDVA